MLSFKKILIDKYEYANDVCMTLISDKNGEHVNYTYNDLMTRVNDYCKFYQDQELKQNDTIVIILKESIDLFASFYAGIIYGALPAYYAYPSPKQSNERFLSSIKDLVEFNDIKLIISYDEVRDILNDSNVIDNSIGFKGCKCPEEITKLGEVLNTEGFESINEQFLQFSSGTTGAKKGVKITSEALFNQVEAYNHTLGLGKNDVIVSWLPHYHDMGLISCMLMPLILKVPIVMMSPFEWVKRPALLLEAIQKYNGTHVWLPNFALGHMCNSIKNVSEFDLSSLKQITCCSEPVLHETIEKFSQHFTSAGLKPNILVNCYAMAENTFAMTTSKNNKINSLSIDYDLFRKKHRVEQIENGYKVISAGIPLSNIEIVIRNEEGECLPEGVLGHIHIKSDCLFTGYHNNSKLTKESFDSDWFNTGDLGFLNKEELYVTGRSKELIIVGGENIYPQDIEQILNEQNGFVPGRNVVFGTFDERVGSEKIVVLAEVAEINDSDIDLVKIKKEVVDKLNVSISEIKILPKGTLLKSTAGKISRHLNKIEFEKNMSSKNSETVVGDNIIRSIVVNNITGSDAIKVTNSTQLFNSGLIDSFGFVGLIVDLEKAYSIKIPDLLMSFENFETIDIIEKTLRKLKENPNNNDGLSDNSKERIGSLKRLQDHKVGKEIRTFKEKILNSFPFPKSRLYRWFLRMNGIQLGKNVQIRGRIHFKIRGKASNIIIGDNVRISKKVDLRNRENGKIIIGNKVYLDNNVRIVAAREGEVNLLEGVEIGGNSVINSGGKTTIGRYTMIAGNVNINSSSHGISKSMFVKEQSHVHGEVNIGDDVWIGSGASILMNCTIEDGGIVSSNSVVSGKVPAFAVVAGVPAKVIKYRN